MGPSGFAVHNTHSSKEVLRTQIALPVFGIDQALPADWYWQGGVHNDRASTLPLRPGWPDPQLKTSLLRSQHRESDSDLLLTMETGSHYTMPALEPPRGVNPRLALYGIELVSAAWEAAVLPMN